jgi:hypothetical protein
MEFLKRISATLHRHDSALPDLGQMESDGELVFVPFGGGDVRAWAFRLAGTGAAEMHIWDRERPPETEIRQQVARIVNLRPGCRAFLTKRPTLEHYLDAQAIFEATGMSIEFCDDDDVAEVLARSMYQEHGQQLAWEQLPARSRKRRRDKVKKLLNTRAAERMTIERLAKVDPEGEIRSWLETIAELAAAFK